MKPLLPLIVLVLGAYFLKQKWEHDLASSPQVQESADYIAIAEKLGVNIEALKYDAAKTYVVQNFDIVLLVLLGVYLVFGFAFHYTYPKG